MSFTRNIGTLIATLLIGSLTFFVAVPRKSGKSKTKTSKTSVDSALDEKDDLFI